MPLDYSLLRSLTAREIVRALKRDGFYLWRQRGSHQQYHHPDGRQGTVSFPASGETFPPKTLKTMIEIQARWDEADLLRLGILP